MIQSAKLLPGSPFQPPEKVARLGKFDDYSLLPIYRRTDSHNTGGLMLAGAALLVFWLIRLVVILYDAYLAS